MRHHIVRLLVGLHVLAAAPALAQTCPPSNPLIRIMVDERFRKVDTAQSLMTVNGRHYLTDIHSMSSHTWAYYKPEFTLKMSMTHRWITDQQQLNGCLQVTGVDIKVEDRSRIVIGREIIGSGECYPRIMEHEQKHAQYTIEGIRASKDFVERNILTMLQSVAVTRVVNTADSDRHYADTWRKIEAEATMIISLAHQYAAPRHKALDTSGDYELSNQWCEKAMERATLPDWRRQR